MRRVDSYLRIIYISLFINELSGLVVCQILALLMLRYSPRLELRGSRTQGQC